MLTATLVMASALWGAQVPEKVLNLFEAHEHRYTGGQYKDELFRYRLFVPRAMNPKERYPLLVWLHGAGDVGDDNQKQVVEFEKLLDDQHPEQYRFFLLVVQCPPTNSSWFRHAGVIAPDDMLTVLLEIVQKTMRKNPVDPDRLYLAGLCSGGVGCWEMAMRYPELFAAVAPMASSGGDLSRVARLVDLPIWVFHSRFDGLEGGTPPDGDEKTVAAIQEAGGNILLTLPPSNQHDCWTIAFQKYGVMTWMLEQRRGAICWRPPGYRPWKWRHILPMPSIFVAVVAVGWWAEWRRRCKKRRAAMALKLCTTQETQPTIVSEV